MLVGIAILGMTVSSVARYNTCAYCEISAGSGYDSHMNSGSGDRTASCYLSNLCGFYDGYVDGNSGDGGFWSDDYKDCSGATGEKLEMSSYYDYFKAKKVCEYHY